MWIILVVFIVILLIIVFTNIEDDNGENYWERRERKIAEYNKQEQEAFGRAGENYVADMLNDIVSSYHGYVFNDFTFMDEKGYSTNIDHIIVCNGGLFVVETKSNKGIIYGNNEDKMWYQKKEQWQEDKEFKNPIMQNAGHINHLRRMMGHNPPKIISMVIFPVADSLDNVDSKYVYNIDSAYHFIIECINQKKCSDQFVDRIYNQLIKIKDKYGISINEHKENIKRKYNN